MITWRIYYGDGTTLDSSQCKPEDAPCRNVQIIVQPHPVVNRQMLQRHDYYWWDFEYSRWRGGDWVGYIDYMFDPGLKIIKFGRVLETTAFDQLYQIAKNDPDFLPYTSRLAGEKP